MADEIKLYIDDLFKYLDIYKNRFSEFKIEAFTQTYNGITAVFSALRQQRDRAVEVDQYFLQKIKAAPLNESDLKEFTIQVLITYFEAEADTDGQSNQSFSYCRGLRPVKQDVPFFERNLIPRLFEPSCLKSIFKLNRFFLKEIAEYINRYGRPLNTGISPEEFAAMKNPMKLLELARRRSQMGNDLISDRNTLEYDLRRLNVFNKLVEKDKLLDKYFAEWKYCEKGNFWTKVKGLASELVAKLKGLFTSYRYFRLSITQRKPAYMFYGLIILIFILLAIYVPSKWNSYSQHEYEKLQDRAAETHIEGGR